MMEKLYALEKDTPASDKERAERNKQLAIERREINSANKLSENWLDNDDFNDQENVNIETEEAAKKAAEDKERKDKAKREEEAKKREEQEKREAEKLIKAEDKQKRKEENCRK